MRSDDGTPKQMSYQSSEELHAFAEDHVCVSDHFESLLDQNAEQWAVVKNRRVIASYVDRMRQRQKLAGPARTHSQLVTRERLEMLQ